MSHKLTTSHLHLWFCTTGHNFSSSEMLAKSVIMFKKTKSSSCIYPTWPLFCSFVLIWPTGWPILLAAKLEISLLVLHQPHHHLPPLPREIPKSPIAFHQGDHCYRFRIYLMMTNILKEIVFTAAIKFQIRANRNLLLEYAPVLCGQRPISPSTCNWPRKAGLLHLAAIDLLLILALVMSDTCDNCKGAITCGGLSPIVPDGYPIHVIKIKINYELWWL